MFQPGPDPGIKVIGFTKNHLHFFFPAFGTIKTDGTVLDKNGTKIGSAPGVNVNVAVMVYFYRDVLENTKVKGSVR